MASPNSDETEELESSNPSMQRITISLDDWVRKFHAVRVRKEDMNKLVINFLVTEAYSIAAQTFEQESGTQPDIDLQCLLHRDRVKQAVLMGNLDDAIEKVREFYPKILDLDTNPQLLFHLQQQCLIELIRNGKTTDALEFATQKLVPIAAENPELLEELEKTMVLLAFEDAKDSPASVVELLYSSQRLRIANEVNAAILTSQKDEKDPKLLSVVRMLMCAQMELNVKADYPYLAFCCYLDPPDLFP